MDYFESLAIASSPTLIKWWFRYVDDVHSATRRDQVNKLQEHLNSIDPFIKFTTKLPVTDVLPFLGTLTKPTSNSMESTVYRKPTHTDRYLDYNSNHPISEKLSVIHTLILRAKQGYSTHEFLAKETDHLQELSYHTSKASGEQYRYTLVKHRVRVFFKGTSTIKSLLMHPKDPIPDAQKTDIIYHWKCPPYNCTAEHIGETNRSLKKEFQTKEIKQPVPTETNKSPQTIQKQNLKVLQ